MRRLFLILGLLLSIATAAQIMPMGPGKPNGGGGGGGGTSQLGVTTIGGTTQSGFNGYFFGHSVTTGANASGYSVNSCSAYFAVVGGAPGWQCAIYTNSAGAPGTKVCASTTITIAGVPAWITSTSELTGCGTLTASTTYWILLTMQDNGTGFVNTGSTGDKYISGQTYGTWPGTLGSTTGDYGSSSLYITVTALP